MDGQQGRGSGLPISGGAVVIALIIGVVFVQQLAFKGSRPEVPGDGVRPSVGPEDVQARLWEDPFAAVRRHPKDIERDRHDIASLAEQILKKKSENKVDEVIVLGIMVFGGPYAENVERRLRSRHASLSALGVLGYVPEDAEHLGYIEILRDEHEVTEEGLHASVPCNGHEETEKAFYPFAPYEWFAPKSKSKPMILLLWLDDDAFHPTPLANIGKVKSELIAELEARVKAEQSNCCNTSGVTFKILGPAGSTNLRAMIKEIISQKSVQVEESLRGVQILSSSATADDHLLLKEIEDYDEHYDNVTDLFAKELNSVTFLRTIGTDKVLTDSLVDELARRGADPRDSRNHIALISEWDTFYGRALPQTFISSVWHKSDKKKEVNWIHQFSYLRGIDGQLPFASKSKSIASGSVSVENKKQDKETEAIERPVGRSQFDYLRRLATRLERWDEKIKRENQGRIKAIGVLGSDVYDKLLVLQALRDRFPATVFFTTDLDARLFHSDEFKWARNLVIASNFGLELHPKLQRDAPPFRDNYQTSLFFSTIIAIHSRPKSLDQETIGSWLKPSRIFEVSRSGTFDLSINQKDGANGIRLDMIGESLTSIHPSRPSSWPLRNTLLAIIAFLLGAVFFLLYTWHYRDSRTKNIILSPALYFSAFALFGALVLGVIIYTQGSKGEPFALLEGISLWPTEFLRFFSGVLSVYFLYTGCRKLKDRNVELSSFFVPKTIPSPGKSLTEGHARPGADDAASLWMTYCQQSGPKRRLFRLIQLSIPYFAVCCSVIFFFGPPFVPYRGNMSLLVDRIALFFAVIPLILLIFGVVDATEGSVWLIRRLSEKKTVWPQAPARCFAKALNIDPCHVNDCIGVHVIAKHSEVVARFIYYPFLVMIVMLISRTSYFDYWDLPLGLLIVILLGVGWAVYCAVKLRRSAEKARRIAVERLWKQQVHAMGQGDKAKHVTEQIGLVLDSIRSIRQGAFVPFFQQPFVQAVGLFLGSGGSLLLLEYVSWMK